jgi:hypothetical protein
MSLKKNDITLAAKHQNIIEQFKNQEKEHLKMEDEINQLTLDLNNIDKDNSKLTIEEIHKKFEISEKISEIRESINLITNHTNEDSYYIKTAHLLYDYYNNLDINKDNNINKKDEIPFWGDDIESDKDEQNDNENIDNKNIDSISINKCETKNLADFFKITITSNEKSKQTKNISDKKNSTKKNSNITTRTTKISKFVTTKDNFNRGDILNKYMKMVDSTYIGSEGCINDNSIFYCERCNIEKKTIHSEGYVVCSMCGDMDHIIIDSEKPSYKEPPVEISYFAYKRINHFNEWLAQFQAKESTEISQEILDMILLEIKKSRIKNMAVLTHTKLREILKKLKLNKYYEHVPHIINRLNGLPPPVISRDIEEKLRVMFKEIQNPFIKVCPKGRKNFLSYSYVLHKFVELLGLDELLPCFPLLKSREKLHQQDKIWKDICYELQWEFIKSV